MTHPGHSVRVPETATYARLPMEQAFDAMTRELDRLLDDLLAVPPDIWINHDPGTYPDGRPWLLLDGANRDRLICRFATLATAERFARAMVARTPGARLDYESIRLAHRVEGTNGAGTPPPSIPQADVAAVVEPASLHPNVVPIRRDVA
jgi:hypothetical protein